VTRGANLRGLGRLVVSRGLGLPGRETQVAPDTAPDTRGQAQVGQLRALTVAVLAMCGVTAAYTVGPTPFGQATLWVVIVFLIAHYETRDQ
jgi:hypothetical protein